MEQQLVNFLCGYVRIRITGKAYDRFLNLCAFHGIRLWELRPSDGAFEACVLKSDFRKLRSIVRKSHTCVRITKRYGFPFFMYRYRKRWAHVAGVAAAILFMVWLSSHVWNISIEGNLSQTDDVIFEYLENTGISHGMSKSRVNTQELASQLRNYFTQFSWVSAELKGTRLVIYVKEGILGAEEDPQSEHASTDAGGIADADAEPSSLVAAKSGTVVSIYVRKGLPAVAAGDTVEKGDLLVTGAIPVYNDDGVVGSWQGVSADADIVLRTETAYYDTLEYDTVLKNYTGKEKKCYMIRIGGWPFSLPYSFDSFALYDLTGEIVQAKISDNFYLPFYFYKYTAREYENLQYTRTREQMQEILKSDFADFIEKLKEKGVQIFENNVTIEWYENSATASGILITGESAVSRTAAEYTELTYESQ